MKILEVVFSVIGIILLVVAAAALIIIITDLILSMFDKRNSFIFGRKNRGSDQSQGIRTTGAEVREAYFPQQTTQQRPEPTHLSEVKETDFYEQNVQNSHAIDYESAAREQEEMERLKMIEEERRMKEVEPVRNIVAEVKKEETVKPQPIEDDFAFDDEFFTRTMKKKEDRIAEILEQYDDANDEIEELTDADEAVNDLKEAESIMVEANKMAEKEIEELTTRVKILEEEKAKAQNDETKQKLIVDLESALLARDEALGISQKTTREIELIRKEKENAQKELAEKDEEIKKLREEMLILRERGSTLKQTIVQEGNTTKVFMLNNATEADLLARLAVLNDRLKVNEREMKKVKREYIPLERVRRTLESDKKKLRRKEAIVAKQNVLLYGVNNYVDIDDEKAKKLTEEHELLDGLRMSVKHCEEVMQNNKDRLPVLEQAYRVLTTNNTGLRDDIKDVEEALALLRARQKEEEEKEGN